MMMVPTIPIESTVCSKDDTLPETETSAAVAMIVSAGGVVVATKTQRFR